MRSHTPTRLAATQQGVALIAVLGPGGEPAWGAGRLIVLVAATVAVYLAVGSPRAWLRGVAGLLFGIVGVAAGFGIGVRWAVKAGLAVDTVAGLVCLVTGAVLLAAGTATLIRTARRWWRLLAVPVALIVLAFGIWPLGIAFAGAHVPGTTLDTDTPARYGQAYADVEFLTADGVVLSGWYLPSRNGRALVLLHGAGSTRSAVLRHADVLARHGYGVLLFDARGHGRSCGRGMDFGWHGDADIAAALSYLQTRPEVDATRIAAVGLSMGGEEAVGAAAADGRIRAVVAEGVTNRTYADKAWLSAEYGWRGWLQERIEWVTYAETDLLTAADQPIALRAAVERAAPRPVLLIAAGEVRDEAVAGRWIQAGSPTTVQIWEVPGAGHTRGLATRPDEWTARVTAFLDNALA